MLEVGAAKGWRGGAAGPGGQAVATQPAGEPAHVAAAVQRIPGERAETIGTGGGSGSQSFITLTTTYTHNINTQFQYSATH